MPPSRRATLNQWRSVTSPDTQTGDTRSPTRITSTITSSLCLKHRVGKPEAVAPNLAGPLHPGESHKSTSESPIPLKAAAGGDALRPRQVEKTNQFGGKGAKDLSCHSIPLHNMPCHFVPVIMFQVRDTDIISDTRHKL